MGRGGGYRGYKTAKTMAVGNSARKGESAESNQPERPRSVHGGWGSCPIEALAHPPRVPWKEAPARPPNRGEKHDGESNGEVWRVREEGDVVFVEWLGVA